MPYSSLLTTLLPEPEQEVKLPTQPSPSQPTASPLAEPELEEVEPEEVEEATIKPGFLSLQLFEFDVVTIDASGQIVQREKDQAPYFTEDLGNGINLDMIVIPGGKFMMGSPFGEGYDNEHFNYITRLGRLFN